MIATYKARLRGDRLDWLEDTPRDLAGAVQVLVTVLPDANSTPSPHVPSGRRLADILRRLARENPNPSIPDPSAWQQETREDRVLPGREV